MIVFKFSRKRELCISVFDISRKCETHPYLRVRPWLVEIGGLLLAIVTEPKDKITVKSVAGYAILIGCTVAFYLLRQWIARADATRALV